MEAAGSPAKALEEHVERQQQLLGNITQAMIPAPGSKAPADKLRTEENRLAELEGQLQVITTARPKVLPHPAAIARYVNQLADVLTSGDMGATGEVLRAALAPFRVVPEVEGYQMLGALNLECPNQFVAGA